MENNNFKIFKRFNKNNAKHVKILEDYLFYEEYAEALNYTFSDYLKNFDDLTDEKKLKKLERIKKNLDEDELNRGVEIHKLIYGQMNDYIDSNWFLEEVIRSNIFIEMLKNELMKRFK